MSGAASNAGSPPPGAPRKRVRGAVDTSLILEGERSRKRTSNAVEVSAVVPLGQDATISGRRGWARRGRRGREVNKSEAGGDGQRLARRFCAPCCSKHRASEHQLSAP